MSKSFNNLARLSAVILSLALCISVFSCGKQPKTAETPLPPTELTSSVTHTQTTAPSAQTTTEIATTVLTAEPDAPKEMFRVVDTSAFRGLYYLDYTADYSFDEFISSGGAANSAELIEYGMKVFPNMELDLQNLGYGCSAFYAESNDGRFILGRNFDMDAKNSGSYLLVHTRPDGAYESFSTVNLKFIGINGAPNAPHDETSPLLFAPFVPLDGINEKGLSIGVLQLDCDGIQQNKSGKIDMTSTSIIRYVLDRAASTDEAIALFENCNLHTEGFAYHYMLGDADGHGAVIEYIDGALAVKRFDANNGGALVCANSYVSDEGIAEFGKPSADSSKRMGAITSALEKSNYELTVQNSLHALYSGSQTTTRWSIVFDCTNKTTDIAINRNTSKFYSFTFEDN
ncbi:MAG: linear amide C-N hydrolase [Clostridia bacterium]|nr:linear amide C-N hydrolase [Clostridia bacterium]